MQHYRTDLAHFPVKKYSAERIIFREGDQSDVAYLIKEGRIEISKELQKEKVVIDVLHTPEMFGEMGLLNKSIRTATAMALTDVELILVSRERFEEFLSETPTFVKAIVRCLSQRLASTTLQMQHFLQENPVVAVAGILSAFELHYPSDGVPSKTNLVIPISKVLGEIEKSLSFSRSYTITILNKLQELRAITLRKIDGVLHVDVEQHHLLVDRVRSLFGPSLRSSAVPHTQQKEWLSLNEVADMSGIDPDTLRFRCFEQSIPSHLIHFAKADILEWL
jgi:CRP-like cAMP-binding protein